MQVILGIGKLPSQLIYIFSSSQIRHDELVFQTVYSKKGNNLMNPQTNYQIMMVCLKECPSLHN